MFKNIRVIFILFVISNFNINFLYANLKEPASNKTKGQKMLKFDRPIKWQVNAPFNINDEKVSFHITYSGNNPKVLFTYPKVGVTPPVTSTEVEITHLLDVRSKGDILEHYRKNIHKHKVDKLKDYTIESGTVFILEYRAIPQGERSAYILSKNKKNGTLYIGPITNLKFDWESVFIHW